MASAQTLRMENNLIKNTDADIPRIDLAKLDNIPYYIESNLPSQKPMSFFFKTVLTGNLFLFF